MQRSCSLPGAAAKVQGLGSDDAVQHCADIGAQVAALGHRQRERAGRWIGHSHSACQPQALFLIPGWICWLQLQPESQQGRGAGLVEHRTIHCCTQYMLGHVSASSHSTQLLCKRLLCPDTPLLPHWESALSAQPAMLEEGAYICRAA